MHWRLPNVYTFDSDLSLLLAIFIKDTDNQFYTKILRVSCMWTIAAMDLVYKTEKSSFVLRPIGFLHMILSTKLDIASRRSVSPDGTWLKRECVGLEPFSWSTRSGFFTVGHKQGPTYSPPPPPPL